MTEAVSLAGRMMVRWRRLTHNLSVGFQDLRIKYKERKDAFTEDHLVSKDPIVQFNAWFQEVKNNENILEPNAMCLSTATKNGKPSSRFVLLKSFGPEGFKFFTNYNSKKGKDLDENPHAALTFYWALLHRQIRVEGTVRKLDENEAISYFKSRPFPSQVGAAASNQSAVIPSREYLIDKAQEILKTSPEEVSKPPSWGGYLVVPDRIEFWQGQIDRLHDRIVFRRPVEGVPIDSSVTHNGENGWVYERLAP